MDTLEVKTVEGDTASSARTLLAVDTRSEGVTRSVEKTNGVETATSESEMASSEPTVAAVVSVEAGAPSARRETGGFAKQDHFSF